MFKICVVGCGAMSLGGHGPSFKKYSEDYKDVVLAGCCDIIEEAAIKYKEEFGFEKHYTDFNVMLDEIKPDVVSLVCPVALTKPLSIEIMKKGYNIILEKPPGLNKEEIGEMLAQAEKSKVFVRTAFNRRYAPLIEKLKELTSGKRIFNITYQMYRSSRRDADFATTAIHAIDAVKNIVGADYKKVDFTYQELSDISENVANIYLNCEFENGVIGQISLVPMGGAIVERITVNTLGESYFVELPFWKNLDVPGRLRCVKGKKLFIDISGSELIDTSEKFEEMGFYEENRSFFELIRSGADISCDLESGIQSVDIANCIRERKPKYEK